MQCEQVQQVLQPAEGLPYLECCLILSCHNDSLHNSGAMRRLRVVTLRISRYTYGKDKEFYYRNKWFQ